MKIKSPITFSMFSLCLILLFLGCMTPQRSEHLRKPSEFSDLENSDEYIWLENSDEATKDGKRAMDWVDKQNLISEARLKSDPLYTELEKQLSLIMKASNRLPSINVVGNSVRNFWQGKDEQGKDHVQGIWRQSSFKSFATGKPNWETLVDFDKLSKLESKTLVFKGAECLPPAHTRCLLKISPGGGDAVELREFDVSRKKFIKDGFRTPVSKLDVSWLDKDTVLIGADFGPGTMTKSSYPYITKKWKRKTPLAKAVEVFRGEVTDVSASAFALHTPEGSHRFLMRSLDFWNSQLFYGDEIHNAVEFPLPRSTQFQLVFKDLAVFQLREELKLQDKKIISGSVIGISLAKLKTNAAEALSETEVIFVPNTKQAVSSISRTKDSLVMEILDDVKGQVIQFVKSDSNKWIQRISPLKGNGMTTVVSIDSFRNDLLILGYEDFLTPFGYYQISPDRIESHPLQLMQAPRQFESTDLTSEQIFVKSKDGTLVPYFIVHKTNIKMDGTHPTLLYGYGGFEVSLTPGYINTAGKVWLERGGIFVMANIRGGGEYGPSWHQAALLENRQRAYDDFIAITEDLIRRKYTSPKHLGIRGGSNGGLLTGAVLVQRPELFNAVVCEVPLLDMIRYPLLGAGESWVGEYGDPKIPKYQNAILKYSPYQNLVQSQNYPEAFFVSSTSDDRVTPFHARKMVAKMESMGHEVLYFENRNGGHGGSANLDEGIIWRALEYTYLWQKLKNDN